MHFAEIVEVVGYAAANERCRVILQQFQEFDDSLRMLVEPGNPHCPGEPQPRPFRYQPAYMRVRVACPGLQLAQRALRMTGNKRSNAALGAEPASELVL